MGVAFLGVTFLAVLEPFLTTVLGETFPARALAPPLAARAAGPAVTFPARALAPAFAARAAGAATKGAGGGGKGALFASFNSASFLAAATAAS